MSHLSIETLARLIEDSASPPEAVHLQECEACRSELEGLRADVAALGALPDLQPPSTQWLAIEQRLADEGLLRAPVRRRQWLRPALQLAAAIAVFLLGTYTSPLFSPRPAEPAPARFAATPRAEPLREDAAAAVRTAEQAYLAALTRYAEVAGSTEVTDPVARLAALESIVLTTRAALGESPADPVINGYHLTAVAQRDATLKQLASVTGKTWF